MFTLNGKKTTVQAQPEMPLLWVLRDILRLTGTKYGCGKGLCGACSVHLDGQAIRSCSTPVLLVEGKNVVTIEGLSADTLHPIQQAWLEENVSQCGYCQSGHIMQAAALFHQSSRPTDNDISAAMAGNLCRCGTYPRVRKAIRRASALARVTKPARGGKGRQR